MLNKKISLILLLLSLFLIIGCASANSDAHKVTCIATDDGMVSIESGQLVPIEHNNTHYHFEELDIYDPTKLNPNLA